MVGRTNVCGDGTSVTIDGEKVKEINFDTFIDYVRVDIPYVTSRIPSIAILNDNLYMFYDTTVYSIDTTNRTCTNIGTIPYSFLYGNGLGVLSVLGNIYMIGGSDTNSTNFYKFDGNSFTSMGTLPFKCNYGIMIPYEDKIYVFYTNSGNAGVRGLYVYDVNSNTWEKQSYTSTNTSPPCGSEYVNCGKKAYELYSYDVKYAIIYIYNLDDNSITSKTLKYRQASDTSGDATSMYRCKLYKEKGEVYLCINSIQFGFLIFKIDENNELVPINTDSLPKDNGKYNVISDELETSILFYKRYNPDTNEIDSTSFIIPVKRYKERND